MATAPRPPTTPTLWTPPDGQPALRRIYWVHIPKTATLFSATVLSYACGPAADDFERVSTSRPARASHTCNGSRSALQAGFHKFWYHMPVPEAVRRAHGSGQGEEVDHDQVVALFRRPRQRLLSALAQLTSCVQQPTGCHCCWYGVAAAGNPSSWGWSMTARSTAMKLLHAAAPRDNASQRLASAQALVHALRPSHSLDGCQAKMLLGIGCHEARVLGQNDTAAAISFVRFKMAFVGLSERYRESVCLWHAMFGRPLFSFELKEPTEPTLYDEAPLHQLNYSDPADELVYAAAAARFRSDLHHHADAVRACVKAAATRVAQDRAA